MFYPSYDDYMRDVFYFNGLANPNMYYMNGNAQTNSNLNNLYPSIYNIVNPVVQKVVNGNNYQYNTEENVNNIVDVVVGITAGDINSLEKEGSQDTKRQNTTNNTQSNSTNTSNNYSVMQNNNNLLRDLIKILVIKELSSRNNIRRFPYTYGSGIPMYPNTLGTPYMMN